MKKDKMIVCLLSAVLIAASFAGCGGTADETVNISNQEQGGQPERQNGSMGKVVTLNGDQLTLLLAEMPDRSGTSPENGTPPAIGTLPENSTPPAMGTPPENGTPPQGGNGPGQPDQGGREITFTGDEITYTLSSDVILTAGMGDSAAEIDLSDLTADDVIRFTTTTDGNGNEVIDSITIM